ncbi:AMP-binding protein [Rhodococcus sp. NPDC019627]|uniref:AMP-binding protein n=1 Tax=unclassified Rhodococcus (in: high G+C Gram-positive bacteria) TaxID=192944 RepID=UPI00340435CC
MVYQPTISDICRENSHSYPATEAVVDGATRFTWQQFDLRVDRVAHVLAQSGVSHGDRILWLAQGSFRFLELLTAAGRLGAMICPVNWRQPAEEMAFVINDLEPSVVFWQEEEIGEAVKAARQAAQFDATWIQHDGTGPDGYEARVAAAPPISAPNADVSPDDALLVIYTAATTERPRGSMLSHRNLISMALMTGDITGAAHDSIFLNSGPLFHTANFQLESLPVYVRGGTNVYTPRVDAANVLQIIADEKVTSAFLMPPTIAEIKQLNREARLDISTLRAGAFGSMWGDDLPADTSPWGQRPGGYGQTELTGLALLKAIGPDCLGNAGRPFPGTQVKIVDPAGAAVPDGEMGEIAIRGDTVHSGYWNRSETNAARFLDGGWWRTTDAGRRELDGSVSFLGTLIRVIKSAAENIYPPEVEGCLKTHPAVKTAAIIGVPDPVFIQSVKAIVVLKNGESVSEGELREYCRTRIASYKKPKFVEFVDSIPTVGGAIDYDALDTAFGGGGYPGESDITKAKV